MKKARHKPLITEIDLREQRFTIWLWLSSPIDQTVDLRLIAGSRATGRETNDSCHCRMTMAENDSRIRFDIYTKKIMEFSDTFRKIKIWKERKRRRTKNNLILFEKRKSEGVENTYNSLRSVVSLYGMCS